jgi:hypothetical protein
MGSFGPRARTFLAELHADHKHALGTNHSPEARYAREALSRAAAEAHHCYLRAMRYGVCSSTPAHRRPAPVRPPRDPT